MASKEFIVMICILVFASNASASFSLNSRSSSGTLDAKSLRPSKITTIKFGPGASALSTASAMKFLKLLEASKGSAKPTTPSKVKENSKDELAKSFKWLKAGKNTDQKLLKSMLPALLARLSSEKTARSNGMQFARVERKVGQSPVYTIKLPSQDKFYAENEVDGDSEYYAKKPFAVREYYDGPRSDQVMLRRVTRIPVSFNSNGRPKTVSRAWNSLGDVFATKSFEGGDESVLRDPKTEERPGDLKSYRISSDFSRYRNLLSPAAGAVSRRSYSKSVHFKPTKAYNGKVSSIYVLTDENDKQA
ncbi:unnamed protein product [Notodromas monacha]|uniref:Uncharacterized protein n=1 Tax=Notodromas monacha TaxID=399045 RepID=A0A7R9BZL3_9CRUS|nr:unnamed protein product [Notodromas monacha]CAG0923600.1 unnamed protein product [Notodromas monacha]